MTNPDWRESEQAPPLPRRVLQGRTDFEDSLLSARRELQAQEKRRSQVLTEALKSRPIASDPDGKLFRAEQKKAIAARRAENARLASYTPATPDFSLSIQDVLEEASSVPFARTGRSHARTAALMVVAALCTCAAAALAFPGVIAGWFKH